jgi:4a-hydroxytetrahydrobiopterin dehydratase
MSDPTQPLSDDEVRAAGLDDWRKLWSVLHARFRTGDFATGLALVDRIGAAAEEAGHHPDIVLKYPLVEVRLSSHDVQGITSRDIDLARQISAFAQEAGVAADPASLTFVEVGLDAVDSERVRPFWAAMLGSAEKQGEVIDPDGIAPNIWFQTPDGPTPEGELEQRWHFDIWVPHDQVQARIDAALAAGGTLVSDAGAPSFWVLADADGNRSCLCTTQGRD